MKRRREVTSPVPVAPPDQSLPLDMLREIASWGDLVTSRFLRGASTATRAGIPMAPFTMEAFIKAAADAHPLVLWEAHDLILKTSVVNRPDAYRLILEYWTERERFVRHPGALTIIHLAHTHFLSPKDDHWALQHVWTCDEPFELSEQTTYAILWRHDVCKEDNNFLRLIKHYIRRAYPQIWKSPFKNDVYRGIAWACAAQDYCLNMWEMLGKPIPDVDDFFRDLFGDKPIEAMMLQASDSTMKHWFRHVFKELSQEAQEAYRSRQTPLDLDAVWPHLQAFVTEYKFRVREC